MNNTNEFRFDEVGNWTEIKLEIIRKYAPAYTKILSKQKSIKNFYYIDGFAGYGIHKSKTRDDLIEGSPLIALKTTPPFTKHFWVDLDSQKIDFLKQNTSTRNDVIIYKGDCNRILPDKVFPLIDYRKFNRALCLLDPYGLHLKWNVISSAGHSRAIEIFLNFPVMDINRNVIWSDPEKVAPEQLKRLTDFWGDDTWKSIAYKTFENLFGDIQQEKRQNAAKKIVDAFRERLIQKAGFKYVPEPIPMKNTNGAPVYYLFFATPNKTAHKIVEEIMDTYRC